MNIIINGFHEKIHFPLVYKILEQFKIKYAYLTYSGSKLKTPFGTQATFYNVLDLTSGDYNVDWDKIIPLDEGLIEKMNDCEVVVLKMMDRLFYDLSYDERKNLYFKHLRYWNHVINENEINLFLSSNVPHEVYDYIIYCLCKLYEIPTILFFQTSIPDTITMMEDFESNVEAINIEYKKLLKKYNYMNESEVLLEGRFKRDFELHTTNRKPVRFEMLRKKPSRKVFNSFIALVTNLKLHRFLYLIKEPSLLIRSINTYIGRIVLDNKLVKFRKINAKQPDFLSKYIYFPLHMQPEVTTSPMAGTYVNQILIAQMIAYYLPKDVHIYIKENPYQTPVGRNIDFYKELLEIPNVCLVPDTTDTYELTDKSLAVTTATGTVGLEALYRCKPVLMFGHNFYQYANGVFQIKSNLDCRQALKEILVNNFKPKIKDLKVFLKVLEYTTIEGYIDVDYKKDTKITDRISNKNILGKLIKEIERVCHL